MTGDGVGTVAVSVLTVADGVLLFGVCVTSRSFPWQVSGGIGFGFWSSTVADLGIGMGMLS